MTYYSNIDFRFIAGKDILYQCAVNLVLLIIYLLACNNVYLKFIYIYLLSQIQLIRIFSRVGTKSLLNPNLGIFFY